MSLSIKKNSIYNILKIFSIAVYPLVTFPYVTRVLGVENVGRIVFGESLVSYVSLIATLGISSYAIRECAKVKDNKEKLGIIASQIWTINIISTLMAYGVLFCLIVFCPSIVDYRILLCVQSLSIVLMTLGADWINTAMEDLRYVAVRTFFFQIVAVILMFVFVRKPEDFLLYAAITLVSSSGGNLVNIFYRRKYCIFKITGRPEIKKHVIPILMMFSMVISQVIYTNSDIVMLKFFQGEFEVGVYCVSVKIYNIVNMFVASIVTVILPQLSFYYKEKKYYEINGIIKYGLNFMVVLGLPCLLSIVILAPELINFVAGYDYISGATCLRILTAALLFSYVGGFCGCGILMASGREKIALKASVAGAVSNLFLNLIFIPSFGKIAAAGTTAVSELLAMIIVIASLEKEVRIENKFKIFVKPLFASFIIGIVCVIFKNYFVYESKTFVFLIVTVVAVYFFVLILLKDEFVSDFIRKKSNREFIEISKN